MTKQFDFDKIGKKVPYRIPEGFFDDMQQQVMKEIETPRRSRLSVVRISSAIIGMAAALAALVFIPYSSSDVDSLDNAIAQPMSINWVEQLSDAELETINDMTEHDVFMD